MIQVKKTLTKEKKKRGDSKTEKRLKREQWHRGVEIELCSRPLVKTELL